jgi:hypothetical protein
VKVPIGGKGGMILLSTDVNATSGIAFLDRIAAHFSTWQQRLFRSRLVDRTISEQLDRFGVATGWSIGPIIKGRYDDPEKRILYLERSFQVEILDAPYPIIRAIAEELRQLFKQREVILKNYETGETEHIQDLQKAPIP